MEAQKPKQSWTPGSRVLIGGREYFVQGQEATAPKGLARAYILTTADQSRTYRWRPFRGLALLSGELVRPRRAKARRVAKRAKADATRGKPRLLRKGNLWHRLKARFGLRVKPRRNVTITGAPGAEIDTPQRQG